MFSTKGFFIKTKLHSTKRVFKVFNLYMEQFSTFQYLTHNSEKLSVYVKCEYICNNKLHPTIHAINEHQGVGIIRDMK